MTLPRPAERGTIALLPARDDPASACAAAYARAGGDSRTAAALVRLARANDGPPCERLAERALVRCAALTLELLGYPRRAGRLLGAEHSPWRSRRILTAAIRAIGRDLRTALPPTPAQLRLVEALCEVAGLLGRGAGPRDAAPWFGRLGYLAGLLSGVGADRGDRALALAARALVTR